MTRKYTKKLSEMLDEGLLDKDTVITAFCSYMSEDDIKDMMEINDFIEPEDEETEE